MARNTGRNRNGNLLMRDMYHFSDRRGGRRSSLLNGSSCNLGMLNRLRDPMYRESGGKSQYSHDTEETLVRVSDPQRRWISNRESTGSGSVLFFSLFFFYFAGFKIRTAKPLSRVHVRARVRRRADDERRKKKSQETISFIIGELSRRVILGPFPQTRSS